MRIYTDASTKGGVSGIAYVVTDERDRFLNKGSRLIVEADNNTAEIAAVLYALKENEHSMRGQVTVFTDSKYANKAIKKAVFRPKDDDLVKEVCEYMKNIGCSLMWIKGHDSKNSNNWLAEYNKMADAEARKVREEYEATMNRQRQGKSNFRNRKNKSGRNDR